MAVGSFGISPNQSIVPVAGCKGGSAAPNTESPTSGGWSLACARGGNGGRGAVSERERARRHAAGATVMPAAR